MKIRVNAVVVTYNRRLLLEECIVSLLSQSYPICRIIIINNNSTDSTNDFLDTLNSDKRFKIINLSQNVGGAGGFNIGLQESFNLRVDWSWLMDDDTIPTHNALENLIRKTDVAPNIGFLSSKVLWINGAVHLMNMVCPVPFVRNIPFNEYSSKSLYLIPSGSFVSFLVNNCVVEKVGLPIKEFFIWLDDIEYSRRIIENGYIGGYVDDSIVVHKTPYNYSVSLASASLDIKWKFYYGIRNSIFMIRQSNSFAKGYLKIIRQFVVELCEVFKRDNGKCQFFTILLKGYISGIYFSPKIPRIELFDNSISEIQNQINN
jgi:GT2 family glycosyltransferase